MKSFPHVSKSRKAIYSRSFSFGVRPVFAILVCVENFLIDLFVGVSCSQLWKPRIRLDLQNMPLKNRDTRLTRSAFYLSCFKLIMLKRIPLTTISCSHLRNNMVL